jgi:hypothetical protein
VKYRSSTTRLARGSIDSSRDRVVVEPGEPFDQAIDHVLVIGRDGPDPIAPVVINGERSPRSVWPAGVRQRVRLINITPDDIVSGASDQ